MKMFEYHTLMWDTLGFMPKKASYGILSPALVLIVWFMVYMTVAKASAQRKSGALVSFMMALPLSLSRIFWLVLSATPFCLGVCGTVNSSLIPLSAQYFSRRALTYLPPWSDHRILVCDPYWFTKNLLSLVNQSVKSDFNMHRWNHVYPVLSSTNVQK